MCALYFAVLHHKSVTKINYDGIKEGTANSCTSSEILCRVFFYLKFTIPSLDEIQPE